MIVGIGAAAKWALRTHCLRTTSAPQPSHPASLASTQGAAALPDPRRWIVRTVARESTVSGTLCIIDTGVTAGMTVVGDHAAVAPARTERGRARAPRSTIGIGATVAFA